MRYLLTLTLLIIIAAGCKKEEKNIDPKSNQRLSKILFDIERSHREETTLSYDKEGYLIKQYLQKTVYINYGADSFVSADYIVYERDADHKITTSKKYIQDTLYLINTYLYNSDGKVSGMNTTYTDRGVTSHTTLSWENDKLIRQEKKYDNLNYFFNVEYKYDDKGNIIEEYSGPYGNGDYHVVTNIVYDDKPNPASTVKGFDNYIYGTESGFFSLATNNVISRRLKGDGLDIRYDMTPVYTATGLLEKAVYPEGVERIFVYENY